MHQLQMWVAWFVLCVLTLTKFFFGSRISRYVYTCCHVLHEKQSHCEIKTKYKHSLHHFPKAPGLLVDTLIQVLIKHSVVPQALSGFEFVFWKIFKRLCFENVIFFFGLLFNLHATQTNWAVLQCEYWTHQFLQGINPVALLFSL